MGSCNRDTELACVVGGATRPCRSADNVAGAIRQTCHFPIGVLSSEQGFGLMRLERLMIGCLEFTPPFD